MYKLLMVGLLLITSGLALAGIRPRPASPESDESPAWLPTAPAALSGCLPTFTNSCSNAILNSFTVNGTTLSQNSGCNIGGYSQFTAVLATVSPGRAYMLGGAFLFPNSSNRGVTVWADLDRNGQFDHPTEQVYTTAYLVRGQFAGSFAIPAGTSTGPLPIRVIVRPEDFPTNPCGSYGEGEVEEYVLNVVGATGCELPTLTVSGSTTTLPGVSVPLIVSQTGDLPYSMTIANNGITQVITVQNYTLPMLLPPVNPTTTTTYFPVSVSNACGVGTVSGSAVVTVQPCEPPTGLSESEQMLTSVRLNWQSLAVASRYVVRWQEVGSPTSTTVATFNNVGNVYLYSLTYGRAYEWQVQTICTNGASTSFSPARSFTMSCPVPFSLTEVVTGNGSLYLRWASTGSFTGYVLQFRPVGEPDWIDGIPYETTFYPPGLIAGVLYEWRIRNNCSDGSSSAFTPIRQFTFPCSTPTQLQANVITGSTALLGWTGRLLGRVEVLWRPTLPANSPFSSVTVTGSTSYSLTGLTADIAYEVKVRSLCSETVVSAFTNSITFTTGCATVSSQRVTNITSTAVTLSWQSNNSVARYNLVYGAVGAPGSTTISSISVVVTYTFPPQGLQQNGGTVSLTGLTNGTAYQFQVQVVCVDGSVSELSQPYSFTTRCNQPTFEYQGTPGSNSIELTWRVSGPDTRYDLVYQAVGAPVATTLSSLSPLPGNLSLVYNLTGLSNSIAYTWKVRTVCNDGNVSDFGSLFSFKTTACLPPAYPGTSFITSSSAILSWWSQAGLHYVVYWRVQGSPTWMQETTSVATGQPFQYVLTGLTNNAIYEWKVVTRCTDNTQSGESSVQTFTARCPTTDNLTTHSIGPDRATLVWMQNYYINTWLTRTVRYRVVGNPDTPWTETGPLSGSINSLTLTGLTNTTTYEWQVGTRCDAGIVSYSYSLTFTTRCPIPNLVFSSFSTDRTQLLRFEVDFLPVTFDIDYRLTTASEWVSLTGLSSTTGTPVGLLLTGLMPNTNYTWRVRSICTDGSLSDYVTRTFTTAPACAAVFTLKTGFWSDQTVWSCGWIPTVVHDVEVRHAITLSLSYSPPNLNQARQVRFTAGGKLLYTPGAKLLLGLP